MKHLFGATSCWRIGALCLFITGTVTSRTLAGPKSEIPSPVVPSESKRPRLSTEDIEAAVKAIEEIQAIASKSKKFDAATAQLESVARVATVSRVRVAAVFAISNLYVEQGRHAEAMSALAKLAGGPGRSPDRTERRLKELRKSAAPEQCRIVRRLPDMRVPHQSSGVAIVEGRIYVWSGYSTEGRFQCDRTAVMEVYDPAIDKWTAAASAPGVRNGLGSFVLGGKIYAVGGEQSPSGSFTNTVHRYDPVGDGWKQLKPFPTKAWDPLCVVSCGTAYVMGGRRGYGRTYRHVYAYDAGKDSWSRKADMPKSVMCSGIESCGGKLYVFGGTHKRTEGDNELLRLVQIYNTFNNSWTTERMPRVLQQVKAAGWGGDIWIFANGMRDESSGKFVPCPWVFRYSPAGGKWRRYRLDLPAGQWFGNPVVATNGVAYLTGFVDRGKPQKIAYAVNLRALKLRSPGATSAKTSGGRR